MCSNSTDTHITITNSDALEIARLQCVYVQFGCWESKIDMK